MANVKLTWRTLLKSCLGISLLALLLLWDDNYQQLLDVFSSFKVTYLLALFLIAIGLNLISSVKWSLFLNDHEAGAAISQWQLFRLYLIGKFFSNFLPSMVGGDLARAYLLGRTIKSHAISAASVIMERITGMIALVFLATLFALLNYEMLSNWIISATIFFGVSVCCVAITLYYWPPFKPFVLGIVRKLPLIKKIASKLESFINAMEYFRARYALLNLSLLYSIGFHVLASVNVYVCCLAIGFEPQFLDILVVTPVILTLTMIPVSPNNIGWWEWCFSILLIDAGATAAEGFAVAIILRVVTLVISFCGGLLFLYERKHESSNEK
jgi:uncharacterized protein (TIRG00374 family)